MKPGIILVRTQLTADPSEFSQAQFNAWYDTQHIPDLLATSGIRAAARYYYSPPAPAGLTTEKAAASADGDSTTMKKSTMPYLAVYWLPDVRWLHEEGCGFWSVPLTVQVTASPNDAAKAAAGQGERDDERQEKSIFELAQVEMEVWEEVKSAKSGEREGAGAEQWAGYQGAAEQLILVLLDAEEGDERDPATVLQSSLPGLTLKDGQPVRSTLFKVDETRPRPPSARGQAVDKGLAPGEKKYLCFHGLSCRGDEIIGTSLGGPAAVSFNLLRTFEDF